MNSASMQVSHFGARHSAVVRKKLKTSGDFKVYRFCKGVNGVYKRLVGASVVWAFTMAMTACVGPVDVGGEMTNETGADAWAYNQDPEITEDTETYFIVPAGLEQKPVLRPRPKIKPAYVADGTSKAENDGVQKPSSTNHRNEESKGMRTVKIYPGLTFVEIERRLGQPHRRTEQAAATVWTYSGRACAMDLYFFFDLSSELYKLLYFRTESGRLPDRESKYLQVADVAECLDSTAKLTQSGATAHEL